MTLAELDRAFKSKKRVLEAEERKKASYDYILADLIGRSIARIYNSSNKLPSINEAYPSLFTREEVTKAKQEHNKIKFMEGLKKFANSHNRELEEGGKED